VKLRRDGARMHLNVSPELPAHGADAQSWCVTRRLQECRRLQV